MPPAPPSPTPAASVPYGEQRWTSGDTPTDFTFTGQRADSFGLLDYNARYYSAGLGRFISPDTIVPEPGNPQSFNRYSFVLNNPVKFVDPSGHCWGFASGLRNTFYSTTCNNLDMAMTIVTSPDATVGQKVGAGAYIGVEAGAHTALVVGTSILAWEGAAAVPSIVGTGGTGTAVAAQQGNRTAQAAQQAISTGKTLLEVFSKIDAKSALRSGIEGLSEGQTQKALEFLDKGRIDRFAINALENNQVQLISERAGRNGFQQLVRTLDPSGKTIELVQKGINAAGQVEHIHDKLNNITIDIIR